MAITSTSYRVLGRVAPAAATTTSLYTATNVSAVISTLSICNQSSSNSTYTIAVRPGDAVLSPKHYIAYNASIPAQDTVALTIGITLAATDVISVIAGNSSTSFNLFGSEIAGAATSTIEYFMVAGGGGGGSNGGGGGGAGGVLYTSTQIVSAGVPYAIAIGTGGANGPSATPGTTGTVSSIVGGSVSVASRGGGGGASRDGGGAGSFGGSGGGGGDASASPQTNQGGGITGQGFNGGAGSLGAGGGGGGGGGTTGFAGSGGQPGAGGAGTTAYTILLSMVNRGINVSGTYYIAGGGAGGRCPGLGTLNASGGLGGGGNSLNATSANGITNTGGGGGGGGGVGGSGGSGIVIIRYSDSYATAASTTGNPVYTITNGYKIYTFTSSGSITF